MPPPRRPWTPARVVILILSILVAVALGWVVVLMAQQALLSTSKSGMALPGSLETRHD